MEMLDLNKTIIEALGCRVNELTGIAKEFGAEAAQAKSERDEAKEQLKNLRKIVDTVHTSLRICAKETAGEPTELVAWRFCVQEVLDYIDKERAKMKAAAKEARDDG